MFHSTPKLVHISSRFDNDNFGRFKLQHVFLGERLCQSAIDCLLYVVNSLSSEVILVF